MRSNEAVSVFKWFTAPKEETGIDTGDGHSDIRLLWAAYSEWARRAGEAAPCANAEAFAGIVRDDLSLRPTEAEGTLYVEGVELDPRVAFPDEPVGDVREWLRSLGGPADEETAAFSYAVWCSRRGVFPVASGEFERVMSEAANKEAAPIFLRRPDDKAQLSYNRSPVCAIGNTAIK